MLIENASDLITHNSLQTLANGTDIELLHFHDAKVMAITHQSMSLYQSASTIDDALGNGLIATTSFPESVYLEKDQGHWVQSYKAGFIGLHGGFAILITPIAIQLFANKLDALHNRNELARLDLPL